MQPKPQIPNLLQFVSSRSSSGQHVYVEDAYDAPEVTLSTPVENLEVLCELLVEFDNMKDNGIDLSTDVKVQGWEQFSNRLQGPIFYNQV